MSITVEFNDRYPGDLVLTYLEVDGNELVDKPGIVVWDLDRGLKKVKELVEDEWDRIATSHFEYSFDGKDG